MYLSPIFYPSISTCRFVWVSGWFTFLPMCCGIAMTNVNLPIKSKSPKIQSMIPFHKIGGGRWINAQFVSAREAQYFLSITTNKAKLCSFFEEIHNKRISKRQILIKGIGWDQRCADLISFIIIKMCKMKGHGMTVITAISICYLQKVVSLLRFSFADDADFHLRL